MAERRMFAKTIVDSDAFLEMPHSTQLLYFHLSMRADDDGFINKPKAIMRVVGCREDDVKILITKKFLIPFESGVVVIKHWKIHNYIRSDRYTETKYVSEKSLLKLDENNAYKSHEDTTCLPLGIPLVDKMDTQVRLGKVSIGKDKDTIVDFFEKLWSMYPRKEGKGQISDSKKKKLFEIGEEEMTRAIERYKAKLKAEKTERKFIKAGSTFFNTGYVDYLDSNYSEEADDGKPYSGDNPKACGEQNRLSGTTVL